MSNDSTKISVTLEDGRVADFGKRTRVLKTPIIDEAAGTISVRFDFVNGAVRHFTLRDDMIARFAAHGASQMIGDTFSTEKDPDDALIAVEEKIDALNAGEWSLRKPASGSQAGTSVIAKAIMEVFGKTAEQTKAFLANKTAAEKSILRNSPKLRPVVERLEAERNAKKAKGIDVEALLEGLEDFDGGSED